MRSVQLFVFLVVGVNLVLGFRSFARGRSKGGSLGEPILNESHALPEDQWFEQFLDHFNPTETRTWKQRYFVNSDFHKKGGPVFLMIGGEGAASPKWMVEGQWIDYARRYGALCFQLEHRFYGKSHPTADLSIKNLVYLTSEQALADLAYFIEGMNLLHQIPAGTKWITFGGSYPGSLAAWSRYKYPHLVHGAMSASGPLLAKIDFQQYYVVVEDALRTHSQACIDAVVAANRQVHIMLRHPVGQKGLAEKFKFCSPVDTQTKRNDIANLYESLASNFAGVVQYNKDNRRSSKTSNITIGTICDILVDEKRGTPVSRLAEMSNLLLEANGEKCFEFKYSKMINELCNVSWADEVAEGGRQWMYQTCTEFGFFQTSTARPQLFSETFPLEFFVQQCTDVFGPKYNMHLLEAAVERTNTIYGAFDLDVSNVVFVHGSIDPWHALGITKSSNPRAPAIYINGTAHCANMYPKSENDPPQLTEARERVGQLIGEWLKN
ncbi:putative serine protease K12H4.7 [Athalia rosae]|uniref:putative serine protease K12H4.7 n=1 Tax=Athalia rosae TaxID=37344 RepID=UPI00203386E2|nr:putative serine protease K12H4.7 [Athalia rosae]XP_012256836.2 putative serine protease K12H4.7 [Athalia rosae]XP_012256837.2 putative serine protease K12H4.7 [Athalia rosae]XP_048515266.1 putative serine protease K12H4.7 [Athalia rosae]